MKQCKILFVITQFYKGGAEVALLNLFKNLSQQDYSIDFLIFDQATFSNARSLISDIPKWITVCNASEKEKSLAIIKKVWFKIYRKVTKHQLCRKEAIKFVKNKEYDIAFSYGEWMSPEFIANRVNAKKKYIWIHTDIDKATFVNPKILLGYDESYTGYIYVSENSKKSAEKAFPVLLGKGNIIHNMCDEEMIMNSSKEVLTKSYTKPLLVSVGNIREEKNYARQIEVMKILQERGVDVTWLCVGSTANVFLYQSLKNLLEKYNLQEKFIFLGVDDNPYKYMAQAEAVTVLSDFESWSLVITEAKIIGIPVIATKTSGAMEQIEDGINGLLTSFDVEDIANKIQEFLSNEQLRKKLRKNLQGFSLYQTVQQEFEMLIKE